MKTNPETRLKLHRTVPNPRGTQTTPKGDTLVARSPDGRFTRVFDPRPTEIKIIHQG